MKWLWLILFAGSIGIGVLWLKFSGPSKPADEKTEASSPVKPAGEPAAEPPPADLPVGGPLSDPVTPLGHGGVSGLPGPRNEAQQPSYPQPQVVPPSGEVYTPPPFEPPPYEPPPPPPTDFQQDVEPYNPSVQPAFDPPPNMPDQGFPPPSSPDGFDSTAEDY